MNYFKIIFGEQEIPMDRLLKIRLNIAQFLDFFFFSHEQADYPQEDTLPCNSKKRSCISKNGLVRSYKILIETVQLNAMDPISISVLLLDFKTQLLLCHSKDLQECQEALSNFFPPICRDEGEPLFPFTTQNFSTSDPQKRTALHNYRSHYERRRGIFVQLLEISRSSDDKDVTEAKFLEQIEELQKLFNFKEFSDQCLALIQFAALLLEKPILATLPVGHY